MSSKYPKAEYEDVTPDLAVKYLANQRENRNLKHAFLSYLIHAMNSGQFNGSNGSPIRFDKDGRLADGQHRLTAIVATGKTQRMLVVRGIDEEALKTIDISVPRSLGDQLRIERGERNVLARVACLNTAVRLLTGYIVPVRLTEQYDEWSKIFKAGIDMLVEEQVFTTTHMRNANLSGALAFAYKADPDAIQALVVKARDGIGLGADDVARTLRDYMFVRERDRVSNIDVAKKVLGACKAVVEGRTMAKLQVSEQAMEYFREFYDRGAARKLVEVYKAASVEAQIQLDRTTRRKESARSE
jgi:hypothetical protein